MRELPILLNTPMVRAILDGRKTQTRIPIKSPTGYFMVWFLPITPSEKWVVQADANEKISGKCVFPPYKPGDILYVRETCFLHGKWVSAIYPSSGKKKYRFAWNRYKSACFIDNPPADIARSRDEAGYFKRPSIFMPKEVARIFLKVTNVVVERVQDITDEGSKAEGVSSWTKDGTLCKYCVGDPYISGYAWGDLPRTPIEAYKKFWNELHEAKGRGWEKNPWVWVIEFEIDKILGGVDIA